MLVLTRKSMESVVVGGSGRFERMLKIRVLEIKKGSVRLGVEADAAVPVHRSEVWERIRKSNGAGGSLGNPAADIVSLARSFPNVHCDDSSHLAS
jgi:carbon storage regulator CsrA